MKYTSKKIDYTPIYHPIGRHVQEPVMNFSIVTDECMDHESMYYVLSEELNVRRLSVCAGLCLKREVSGLSAHVTQFEIVIQEGSSESKTVIKFNKNYDPVDDAIDDFIRDTVFNFCQDPLDDSEKDLTYLLVKLRFEENTGHYYYFYARVGCAVWCCL